MPSWGCKGDRASAEGGESAGNGGRRQVAQAINISSSALGGQRISSRVVSFEAVACSCRRCTSSKTSRQFQT
eukprot:scaffold25297_cov40-Tisochrysis_lutea.AAC.4